MSRLEFLLVDVFTERPFGGSRLTLFPDGGGIAPQLMQTLAQEMGPGETAFVTRHDPDRMQCALRVFTPSVELPFAGHSVLGATFAFDHLGRLPREGENVVCDWRLEAGTYRVYCQGEGPETVYSLEQESPNFLGQYFQRRKVARTLGLPEHEIAITGLPCEIVSTGLPIHVVPIASLQAMRAIRFDPREADAIARDLGFGDLFVFTCETIAPDAGVHCRMFAPHFGIPEDPASGSATGALAAYLIKHRLIKVGPRVQIVSEQGIEMGRPSRLVAEVEVERGRACRILVGGRCVLVGRGQIDIP